VRHASPSKQKSRLAIRTLNFANQRSLLVWEHPGRAEIKHEGSASVRNVAVRHFRTRRRARGPRFRRAHRTRHRKAHWCRDFTHLALALCRCLNIPARYCTTISGDIGSPSDRAPIDSVRGVKFSSAGLVGITSRESVALYNNA
jgi:hypothetical protein